MKHNVIILTSGLSGSSVLTGLICRAGFWTGDRTHKKPQYDTFENSALIELNLKLFEDAGYSGNYLMEFSQEVIDNIRSLQGIIKADPYRQFVDKCNEHRPWIWKDPRLWLTIRFWQNLLDFNDCKFILLSRDPLQSWISQTLRRQITTYRYSRSYERLILQSALDFVTTNRLSFMNLRYEDLICRPSETIRELNDFLGTRLTVDNLRSVYNKPLYKSPRSSVIKHFKAAAIYARNYSERLDLTSANQARVTPK